MQRKLIILFTFIFVNVSIFAYSPYVKCDPFTEKEPDVVLKLDDAEDKFFLINSTDREILLLIRGKGKKDNWFAIKGYENVIKIAPNSKLELLDDDLDDVKYLNIYLPKEFENIKVVDIVKHSDLYLTLKEKEQLESSLEW
ncbi:MAG: hypothetical protein SPJ89_06455 [Treponema sp.]|nr:hypothetical protein [Spirochaetales bacterium]MDY5811602.1 hypothetical protein [Treponema sp.]